LSELHLSVTEFFAKPLLGEKINQLREIIDALQERDGDS
jgi:hypothetical protein